MRVFVVERYLPALTADAVAAQARAEADVVAAGGPEIRHLRTTYLCDDELCFSVFEAPSIDIVRQATDLGEMPYERISEAVEVTREPMEGERCE